MAALSFPRTKSPQFNVFLGLGIGWLTLILWLYAREVLIGLLLLQTCSLIWRLRDGFGKHWAKASTWGVVTRLAIAGSMATWDEIGHTGEAFLAPINKRAEKWIRRDKPKDPYLYRRTRAGRRKPRRKKQSAKSAIPDREEFPELPNLKGEQKYKVRYWIEEHKAKKAGLHYDITIEMPEGHRQGGRYFRLNVRPGNRKTKYGVFPKPGEQVEWRLSPLHDKPTNPPVILEGYGAGTTRVAQKGAALIWFGKEGRLHFMMEGVEGRYALVETSYSKEEKPRYWAVRLKPRDIPSTPKPKMKVVKLDSSEYKQLIEGSEVMAVKKDGARCNIKVSKGQASIGSYRPDKRAKKGFGIDQQIDYTDKVRADEWQGLDPTLDFEGSGEVWVRKDPHMTKVNSVLQWDPVKGRKQAGKYKAEVYIHDLNRYQGKDVSNLPYSEKLKIMDKIWERSNHNVKVVPYATTPKGKKSLRIKAQKEPGVDGVVFNGNIKSKWRDDKTYKIVGIQSEKDANGIEKDTAIPIVKVGRHKVPVAGKLTQTEKRELKANPDAFIGREVDISFSRKTANGKPFQPVFERWREE